jgi:hypothetical protein
VMSSEPRGKEVSFHPPPRKWKVIRKEKEAAARAVVWKKEKEAKAAAAAIAAATKTHERNKTYVTKMLSLPKLVFTEQVHIFAVSVVWIGSHFSPPRCLRLGVGTPFVNLSLDSEDAEVHAPRRSGGHSGFFHFSSRACGWGGACAPATGEGRSAHRRVAQVPPSGHAAGRTRTNRSTRSVCRKPGASSFHSPFRGELSCQF